MIEKLAAAIYNVMINGIIYMYTSPSGKRYIGQTINETKRKSKFNDLTKLYAGGGKLEHARLKYLPENFTYEILESIIFNNKDEIGETLNNLEIKYIKMYDTYKTGYNSSVGGRFNYSEKSSMSHIGKKHSEETKLKISKGIKKTKSSENYYQKPMSSENIEKARNRQSKKILQYSLSGEFIKEWDSGKSAGLFYNVDAGGILKCCKGKNKTSTGYIWRFKINDIFEEKIVVDISTKSSDKAKNALMTLDKANKCKKSILQYDINNNFIKEWESVSDIYHELNKNGGGIIAKVCTGKLEKAYGFIWKYKFN